MKDVLSMPPARLRLMVAGLMGLLALGYLVYAATTTTAVYYLTVSELREQPGQMGARPIRVSGWVVDGSIEKKDPLAMDFVLTDGSSTIPVSYKGVVPDLFGYSKDDLYQEVVVEGRLGSDQTVVAANLIVKHGPEFRASPDTVSRNP